MDYHYSCYKTERRMGSISQGEALLSKCTQLWDVCWRSSAIETLAKYCPQLFVICTFPFLAYLPSQHKMYNTMYQTPEVVFHGDALVCLWNHKSTWCALVLSGVCSQIWRSHGVIENLQLWKMIYIAMSSNLWQEVSMFLSGNEQMSIGLPPPTTLEIEGG